MRPFSQPFLLFFGAVFLTAGAASHLTACATKTADKTCAQDDDKSELQMCGARAGMVKGIDVSAENGVIDWAQVKKGGYGWAYAMASDGLEPDAKFADNWKGMKTAGVVRGAYQYFYPKQDVEKQAELFVKTMKDAGKIGVGDLPPVLDLEESEGLAGKDVVEAAKTWLELVEKGTGRKAMVLTNPAMAKLIGTTFRDRALWVAQYRNDCPDLPTAWKSWSWDFWTYSEKLKVPGVSEGLVYSAFFQGTGNDLKVFTLEASPDGGAGDGGSGDASVAADAGARDGASASDASRDAGTARDSGSQARDSGGAADGGSSAPDAGAPQDDGGSTGGGEVTPPDEEPQAPPPSKGKTGPRAQREEEPPADPCASKASATAGATEK